MPTQKKTAYHHGNLKQTLVNAAFEALKDTSWENLSLRKLAQQAGVTPTAAYNHFQDKVELMVEVKTEAFLRFHTYLTEEVAKTTPTNAQDHIIALGRAYMAFNVNQPAIYNLLFSWAPSADRMTEELMTSAGACELLIDEAVANYLSENGIDFDKYTQSLAAFFSWSVAHGISTLISGGNVQAAAMCNNFPPAFLFNNEQESQRLLSDLFDMLVAGIKHGLPEKP
jgi:AcrR family transcriptional regulator